MKISKQLRRFVFGHRPHHFTAVAVIAVFAFAGGIILFSTKAAGPFIAAEPELGTITTPAATISDTTAGGGSAVKFAPGGGTGSCPVSGTHVPGGPDGMGGCWPYEGNTGVPAGTQLTAYTGPCVITTDNTVIDRKLVNCSLSVRAKNIVITKSQINGFISADDCVASFNVSDSRIHLEDLNFRSLFSCNFVATRVDASGGQSMAFCRKCTIQDSYLHSPLEDPTGKAHNSTVRMADNAIIKHNTLWCFVRSYPEPGVDHSSGCSANQTGYSHDGNPPFNSRVEANLYMPTSGGFCAYGGSTSGELDKVHDIVFINNIFKRGTDRGDHNDFVCGYYGAITSFDSSRPGNQWINNRWDDGTILPPAN